jgi:hypothetical protein
MLASERSVPPNQIGSPAQEVADHDPVGVAFADRYLVDPNHLRSRPAHALRS